MENETVANSRATNSWFSGGTDDILLGWAQIPLCQSRLDERVNNPDHWDLVCGRKVTSLSAGPLPHNDTTREMRKYIGTVVYFWKEYFLGVNLLCINKIWIKAVTSYGISSAAVLQHNSTLAF